MSDQRIRNQDRNKSGSLSAIGRKSCLRPLALVGLAIALASCGHPSPKGQVVAIVNGKEITTQDLISEAHASGDKADNDPRVVLQRVVARTLLAQAAHSLKLDAYSGYPSDLIRLQQTFLAQKVIQAAVKQPPQPSSNAIAAYMAANPYQFADRASLQVDEIQFQTTDNLQSVDGLNDLASVASRLQTLNVPFERRSLTIDSADLPSFMVQKICNAPIGEMLLLRTGDSVLALVVQARIPATVPSDQQEALAAHIIEQTALQHGVDAEVQRLRAAAHITYQPTFAPPANAGATPQ